ncbi:MAG: 2-polyprenylphenol hydroxylase [Rickettsiaceae bacterium]|nr:2-polyprenylphenol hydroxylase [Rickettsiaceae bacterium]
MQLKYDLDLQQLYSLSGLKKLEQYFIQFLTENNSKLALKYLEFRQLAARKPSELDATLYSELLLEIATIFDEFIANLFNIESENLALQQTHNKFAIIYECRRKFVKRFAVKKYPVEKLTEIDFTKVSKELTKLIGNFNERNFARHVINWQLDEETHIKELDIAAKYAAYMVHNNSSITLFNIEKLIDPANLIRKHKIQQLRQELSLGFAYRDPEINKDTAIAEANYCIYCHKQGKDSCSKGFSKSQSDKYQSHKQVNNVVEKNGCPLEQKISEMNKVMTDGYNIAALAIIIIDNPLVAATGHRICNDCMKACIYQKQDPVNIPLIESKILDNVLNLPYGVEIYLLLTRWNPLNIFKPISKVNTGYNILVTGLGPSGFALSHYLLNEGHSVIAIDGMKIDPIDFDISKPIKDWQKIKESLTKKIPTGFGGVAEYGITNRWDKNNLSLIRLMLERRDNFKLYGGVRLGSNILINQAFKQGFDHIALCLGAGSPKYLADIDYFLKGVRSAADFLMNLQQGGAFLKTSNSNLTIRMPAIVIGLGLTAIDSASEILHYYPELVENFYNKYEKLTNKYSEEFVKQSWNDEDKEIALEYITHAKLFRRAKNTTEKLAILNDLGGVTICYHKKIIDSPAYRLNHEEIEHAMALGIKFQEEASLNKIIPDKNNYAKYAIFNDDLKLSARTIIMAIGTKNNEFNDIDYDFNSTKFSHFGDCDPKYTGSVVKALASVKNGYQNITKKLPANPSFSGSYAKFTNNLEQILVNHIVEINIIAKNVVELMIDAPQLIKNFQPGQFFRLQNYSKELNSLTEPIALTGAYVDESRKLLSLIILEIGKSTKLCRNFKVGDKISLMGPTGVATKIAKNKSIALIGGGLGNGVLLSVGKALKENGCQIIYFAGYRKLQDRFYPDKITTIADRVIWCCDEAKLDKVTKSDLSIHGNILDGLKFAKENKLVDKVTEIICIGSDSMMQAVSNNYKEYFNKDSRLICSLNSPMQCMMKGICGQCLQKVNSSDGYIFSCKMQDQRADIIDFTVLKNRLGQNSLLEKISLVYVNSEN